MPWNFKEVKEQVEKVIAFSQNYKQEWLHIDGLMADWYNNKKRFMFDNGKELIYQMDYPMTAQVSESDKCAELDNFIDHLYWQKKAMDLAQFVDTFKKDFYTNITSTDYVYKDYHIPKGMKIIKAFKYFIEDKELLDAIQTDASRLIQTCKLSGTFCMSVHPLDYLSLSENTYNWRSCHALDGEYRAGNLSYMTDGATVICYLKGDEDAILPRFPSTVPWTNKKWRMLLHISDDNKLVIAGRQYPFNCEDLKHQALEAFKAFYGRYNNYTDWVDEKYNNYEIGDFQFDTYRQIPLGEKMYSEKDVIIDPPTPLHYNDPLYSTVYDYSFSEAFRKPYWFIPEQHKSNVKPLATLLGNGQTKVHIGHPVKCCICGKEDCVLSETMLCINCELEYGEEEKEDFTTCQNCGRRIYIPEAIEIDEMYYCDACGGDSIICANCGERAFTYMHDDETNEDYCLPCYDEIIFDREQEEGEEE